MLFIKYHERGYLQFINKSKSFYFRRKIKVAQTHNNPKGDAKKLLSFDYTENDNICNTKDHNYEQLESSYDSEICGTEDARPSTEDDNIDVCYI